MTEVISRLASDHDFVIIDGAPLLPVADSQVLLDNPHDRRRPACRRPYLTTREHIRLTMSVIARHPTRAWVWPSTASARRRTATTATPASTRTRTHCSRTLPVARASRRARRRETQTAESLDRSAGRADDLVACVRMAPVRPVRALTAAPKPCVLTGLTTARVPRVRARRTPGLRLGAPVVPGLIVLPGFIAAGVFVLWGVHDGGYDNDTWYWGALGALAMLAGTVSVRPPARSGSRAAARVGALPARALRRVVLPVDHLGVAPGVALQGSNRALLYLLLFALMLVLPWRPAHAQAALGPGRSASASSRSPCSCVWPSRTTSPCCWSTASRRADRLLQRDRRAVLHGCAHHGPSRSPAGCRAGPRAGAGARLRGASARADRAEPRMAVHAADRRLVLVAVVAAATGSARSRSPLCRCSASRLILHRLLDVYDASRRTGRRRPPRAPGRRACSCALPSSWLGTLLAWADWLPARAGAVAAPPPRGRNTVGLLVAGRRRRRRGRRHARPPGPLRRAPVERLQPPEQRRARARQHFADVGSGRYDFWRVALDAFTAHPIGGLGQDNFADYYVVRGHSGEEPSWTHSLEMRLLAHTGVVGFAALRRVPRRGRHRRAPGRRRATPRPRALAAAALHAADRLGRPRVGRLVLGDAGAVGAGAGVPRPSPAPSLGLRTRAVEPGLPRRRRSRPVGAKPCVAGAAAARRRGARRHRRPGPALSGRRARCRSRLTLRSNPRAALAELARRRPRPAQLRRRPAAPGRSPCRSATCRWPRTASPRRCAASRATGTPSSAPGWPRRRSATEPPRDATSRIPSASIPISAPATTPCTRSTARIR